MYLDQAFTAVEHVSSVAKQPYVSAAMGDMLSLGTQWGAGELKKRCSIFTTNNAVPDSTNSEVVHVAGSDTGVRLM